MNSSHAPLTFTLPDDLITAHAALLDALVVAGAITAAEQVLLTLHVTPEGVRMRRSEIVMLLSMVRGVTGRTATPAVQVPGPSGVARALTLTESLALWRLAVALPESVLLDEMEQERLAQAKARMDRRHRLERVGLRLRCHLRECERCSVRDFGCAEGRVLKEAYDGWHWVQSWIDEPQPSAEELRDPLTYAMVQDYPAYFLAGPGRYRAEHAYCEHDYTLVDSCPVCDMD